jgi:hypothetical protein
MNEKLYRLKEKAKQFVSSYYHERVEPMGFWHNHTAGMCEHLEEVPQRVELELDGTPRNEDCYLVKTGINITFTEEERLLCEQALNGKLYTLNEIIKINLEWRRDYDGTEFNEWLNQNKDER